MKKILYFVFLSLILGACASIGNPSGGPRDEEPPRFVSSNPHPYATNFKGKRISLYFNELINVKDAFNKVIISPPSASAPRVSSLGKRVIVSFEDSLMPNTTYTIDFADAIEDNNEANPLENFSFTFSTGSTIDSLGFSGMVLNAENLEPMQGKLVGIHLNHADSALRKIMPDYVARTDDYGRFFFQGLRPGKYRVFALDDLDGDMKYSSPEEEFAFSDFFVEPYIISSVVSDTLRDPKTGEIDTIKLRTRRMLMPNDILLRSYTSRFKQQYITNYERVDSTRLRFTFNSPSPERPKFSVIGAPNLKNWAIPEISSGNDSITLWIKSGGLIAADTLRVEVNYLATDSSMNLASRQDTLRLTFDRRKFQRQRADEIKKSAKEWKQKHKSMGDSAPAFEMPLTFMGLSIPSSSTQEVNLPLLLETERPLQSLDTLGLRLEERKDSVWRTVTLNLSRVDSLQPRRFRIDYPWKYETDYRLTIDSLAMTDIYGYFNKGLEHTFKTKKEEDYSVLTIHLQDIDPEIPVIVELLNQDNPIRRERINGAGSADNSLSANNTAVFEYLNPGTYYVRMYEDLNGNGIYDPGDYDKGIQPDHVYYYPKKITLKKNWNKEETWHVYATPVNLQKPEDIRKNKPKQRKFIPAGKKKNSWELPDEEEE